MLFFTFNYTKTLQELYGISKITHIHNRVGQKLILGHGNEKATYEQGVHMSSEDINIGLQKPTHYQRRARSFSFGSIKMENEYDFQNLIHFLMRPVFSDIISETFEIEIDGNSKYADFALMHSQIVVEAKWIDTTNKKAEVLKTLKGLADFYTQNPNVRSLIMVVLCKSNVELDTVLLEHQYSFEKSTPPIYVRFLKSEYAG